MSSPAPANPQKKTHSAGVIFLAPIRNLEIPRIVSYRKKIKASVVDLFSGAGGLSYGFKLQSFMIAAGVDIDENCRFPYEKNIDAPFLRRDVGSVTPKEVNELFEKQGTRVLVGCAPCQPFSTYNQKNKDPNWRLLEKFGKLVTLIQPDIVSMENVPRLLNFNNGIVFKEFVDTLRSVDYYVAYDVLYGPNFGLAQTRSRLVLLASRLGKISLPKPTHKNRHRTVHDEIGKLRPLDAGEEDQIDPLHQASRLSTLNKKRIRISKPGGTWRDWSNEIVTECHKASTGRGYSSVYGRMSWSKPSPTITTQFFGFGNGRFGHPEQDRALSLREGALLQGFPKTYEFVKPGERIVFKKIGRLIGNAVPVRLAEAIARAVKTHIETST